nr:putative RNA-directed DNA polymerase, eukaryota, reverse transcriptase zinc-binding domain protein [Tanacetum cinerariifolium]
MGGRNFTWMYKSGSKMSKLDRFFISNDVLQSHPELQAVVLDRIWSDHNPILLFSNKNDFGPIPFKYSTHDRFPQGSNSGFITLIPKVNNPLLINDYRPISLIGIHYKIVAKILAIRLAKVIDSIISPEQSTFISGHQILDGPLIISQIIDWYKKRKKKMLLFKVDFEKAFDFVSWRYLDYILEKLGFGIKWRSWLKSGLVSSRTSILVNGSPTSEFSLKRGLRQGDPLSALLFIIVLEALHMALKDGQAANLFHGVKVGSSGFHISHLFYTDDVIILSDWNQNDMDNIIQILNIFYIASGLKINIHKLNIFGVGVSLNEINSMAANTRCTTGSLPFTYLGLPIGSNMSCVVHWQVLIDRFKSRLSGWKANLLSIGGRLTLIKSMLGSLRIYYLSTFKAPETVLKSLESLRASFFWGSSKDSKNLSWIKWSNTLSSHEKGGLRIGRFDNNGCQVKGAWANIVGSVNKLYLSGIVPLSSIRFKVGDRSNIRFWKDIWLGNVPLYIKYNRLFHLDNNKDYVIRDRIANGNWSWDWSRSFITGRTQGELKNLILDIANMDPNEIGEVFMHMESLPRSYFLALAGECSGFGTDLMVVVRCRGVRGGVGDGSWCFD